MAPPHLATYSIRSRKGVDQLECHNGNQTYRDQGRSPRRAEGDRAGRSRLTAPGALPMIVPNLSGDGTMVPRRRFQADSYFKPSPSGGPAMIVKLLCRVVVATALAFGWFGASYA